jgi:hypothetical protein
VHFPDVHFEKMARFDGATFKEKVAFYDLVTGSNTVLDFRKTIIEKPERVYFHNTNLHPSWFVDVDSRKFDFANVSWYGLKGAPEGRLEDETKSLQNRKIKSPHMMLAQACRRLSANAEENREYPLANEFHYWSMDALRIARWHYLEWLKRFIEKNWRRISTRFGLIATLLWIWRIFRREPLRHTMPSRFGFIPTFYWALSGYGVRAGRAFLVLGGICVAFAVFYMLLGPTKDLQNFWTALVYSMGAMVRLNPNPRPDPATDPGLFQFLVIAEGILGPLQIALLALAIRRKVMR